jgi:hypothetical protein
MESRPATGPYHETSESCSHLAISVKYILILFSHPYISLQIGPFFWGFCTEVYYRYQMFE